MHVPLTPTGDHATRHFVSEHELSRLNCCSLLINTSRGAVVDGEALKQRLGKRQQGNWHLDLALDVWENEPTIDTELLAYAKYSTGHIAGYSRSGKERGSATIVNAMCRHFYARYKNSNNLSMDIEQSRVQRAVAHLAQFASLRDYQSVVQAVIDPVQESKQFKAALSDQNSFAANDLSLAERFDRYRKQYKLRAEIDYG